MKNQEEIKYKMFVFGYIVHVKQRTDQSEILFNQIMLQWNETHVLKKSNKMSFFLFHKEVMFANNIEKCQTKTNSSN
jgi:hypothetical protein